MTSEEWKRNDKRIRQIDDPFGTGFPALRKLIEEWIRESGLSMSELLEQYMAWKWLK